MKIFKHASTVSIFTGISRILGLLREIFMADLFGTSLAKSAFDVAFRIPNLFRRLFGEGALSAAFVPVFSETLKNEGNHAARKLAGKVLTMLTTLLLLITFAVIIITTITINQAQLGEKAAQVLPLLRIMFPYMFFICIIALCMGILNANLKFALPAATPIILNLTWIAALFVLCPRFGKTPEQQIYGVAWGVLIAGIIQLAIQIPALKQHNMLPIISFNWNDKNVRKILMLMGPAALGMGIHQINVGIDGLLALWVSKWAAAALTYAERLVYLPLGIFATALSTVLLPSFSKHAEKDDTAEICNTISDSIRGLMLIMVPATLGLIILATPITRLIFQRGKFDAQSTLQTAHALWFYAPGLIVFSLYKILTPAFYAMKDTRTPVKVGIIAVVINLTLNITFIMTWPPAYKHAGLACATVIASAVNCLILASILTKRVGSPGWLSLTNSFIKTAIAATLMAGAVIMVNHTLPHLSNGFSESTPIGQALNLSASLFVGILIYTIAALTICRKECRTLLHR